MSDSDDKLRSINIKQKAESRNENITAQAAGINPIIHIGDNIIPLDKLLIGVILTIIILQFLGYACAIPFFGITNDKGFAGISLFYLYCCCYPILFFPISVLGLVIGLLQKNYKLIGMSLVSGVSSLCMISLGTVALSTFSIMVDIIKQSGYGDEIIDFLEGLSRGIPTQVP